MVLTNVYQQIPLEEQKERYAYMVSIGMNYLLLNISATLQISKQQLVYITEFIKTSEKWANLRKQYSES